MIMVGAPSVTPASDASCSALSLASFHAAERAASMSSSLSSMENETPLTVVSSPPAVVAPSMTCPALSMSRILATTELLT